MLYIGLVSIGLLRVFFLMIRRPPRSTLDRSSAASDVYKRQVERREAADRGAIIAEMVASGGQRDFTAQVRGGDLSLIHISEPTRPY